MSELIGMRASRRKVLAMAGVGAGAGGLLTLSGCATYEGVSLTEAVRRMLLLSSERAFLRLTAPGGYWDDGIASLGLGDFLGIRGNILSGILTSALFKDRLEVAFASIAQRGAQRAAPLVTEAVRVIGVRNALALVNGGPTAATDFLRGEMGMTLIEAMVPEIATAMRIAQEPLVGELVSSLTGVDAASISRTVSANIENAIWREIGIEEAAIRADPFATRDPLIIGVFGAGRP